LFKINKQLGKQDSAVMTSTNFSNPLFLYYFIVLGKFQAKEDRKVKNLKFIKNSKDKKDQ